MTIFRLAHLSDFHLSPEDLRLSGRELASKRLFSLASWRRKRRRLHRPEILAAIIADVAAHEPDHIAVTGDLTNLSTTQEFEAVLDWLERLGPPERVTVSPGNHDALVARGLGDRLEAWGPWLGDEPVQAFPQVRRRDGVAVVNLCSAAPTAPLLAQGRLGEDQLARLAEALGALGREGLFRVLLLHHPIAPGLVSARKALVDRKALREVLAAHGAELVLHGHAHEAAMAATPGPGGTIPMLGVPSASASPEAHGQPARWHAVEIDPDAGSVRLTARGFSARSDRIEELGRYSLA